MRINNFTPDTKIFEFSQDEKYKEQDNLNFENFLKEKLDSVNEKQIKAEETTQNFITGEEKNIHNVMVNTAEAKLSLDMAIEVRNKIVEAYQELNRMQV
ncbi:flagellar hook-basal body complex protein FliE [Haloimpatiens massiliensis]|uniref:flagellar hook-basal body complex protein FliE n=1 Tax=Haloimpatiens massiliensis TaxID=1658110 RepID=UPI000C84A941|nr:flagellar hook-basal body complex protein FliE [Haloimpatiens massiliensis]